jgi:DNA invertase Pin-like site-specific DNA recombinase
MALTKQQRSRHLEIFAYYQKQIGKPMTRWALVHKKYGVAYNTLKKIINENNTHTKQTQSAV